MTVAWGAELSEALERHARREGSAAVIKAFPGTRPEPADDASGFVWLGPEDICGARECSLGGQGSGRVHYVDELRFWINGAEHRIRNPNPSTLLVDYLHSVGLTGTKASVPPAFGCFGERPAPSSAPGGAGDSGPCWQIMSDTAGRAGWVRGGRMRLLHGDPIVHRQGRERDKGRASQLLPMFAVRRGRLRYHDHGRSRLQEGWIPPDPGNRLPVSPQLEEVIT